MKRIDWIISQQTNYSRREIKQLIIHHKVFANNKPVLRADEKFDEINVCVKINGKKIDIIKHVYLLLNKPMGYVSTTDGRIQNVLDLVPQKYKNRQLFPAGRLDKDTTGLMLITDDGKFAHNILSPKKHVKKTYQVTIDLPVTDKMIEGFKNGVMLNDGECKSAVLEKVGECEALVTLSEGRYHQIKRMFGCFKAKVTKLNRIGIGSLFLPEDLILGNVREATIEELNKLQQKQN